MNAFTKRTKGRIIALLLCFAFICGAFALFGNTSTTAFAHEQNEMHGHGNLEGGLESYSGYGCNDGVDLQVNLSGQIENNLPEFIEGFGCGSSCGASREDGYSSSYYSGCRNWQVMPLIGPMFKYWIDESTLSSLTTTQRAQFIADVDGAAAEWNSVRINDYSGAIVNLQKMSSNGIDVVPIEYDPNLSGASGKFNPVPLFHWIKIKYLNSYSTILHEFGHMIGLQDLDLGKAPVDYSHISLMGYADDGKMHYQDIQGLAVANYKHTTHDYRKYWRDGARYNYICFYCDITDSVLTSLAGGTQLADAASCLHTYERLASAGNRYWQKCPKCYKVVESEFTVSVKGTNSVEITGLIDNRTTIIIPSQIGGQNVTHIGNSAFSGQTGMSQISIPASVTFISTEAFKNCPNLTSVTIPWDSWMPYRGSCSHTNKVKYLANENYHWYKCTSCYETFRAAHTMNGPHVNCACGLVEECKVSSWTISTLYHTGTCLVCNKIVKAEHIYHAVFSIDRIVYECKYCRRVPSDKEPIIIWSKPRTNLDDLALNDEHFH